ncbi:MAG TPA: tetratricopeptide repeat protein [Terriglobia bacterium]|nr:tetratricopeptide repeat protein [Terriglobia bacterium]
MPSAAGAMGTLDGSIPFMEEHVLERISALENSIAMLNKRVDTLIETVERVAASNFIDHTMIETLTDSLESAGIDLANLESDWRKRIDSRIVETEAVDRLSNRTRRVLEAYRGADRKQFEKWIERSYDLLVDGRGAASIELLNSALDCDPDNLELGLLLAEAHFQACDDRKALDCLERVLSSRPDDFEATLLAGVLEERTGNLAGAERRLERAIGLRNDSAAAHAVLGAMLSRSGNRKGALKHLTAALELKASAPVHFLLGGVYHEVGQHRRAIQHLKQATELDPSFGEAFYQLGLLCLEMNWLRKAQECFKTAQSLNPGEARYRRRAPSFSEGAGPDQLNGLVREELRLVHDGASKRR